MDFGEILNEWERIKQERGGDMERRTVVESRSRDEIPEPERRREEETRRLAELRPQAQLDLHGMTAAEAEEAVAAFLRRSARNGFEKVLIIHGKGNHSRSAPVLKSIVRRVLEKNALAGRFGPADRTQGGSGATWVYVRRPVR
jgi:DNA-nicking Smr family endonuclease